MSARSTGRLLEVGFYRRPALEVARDLLGRELVSRCGDVAVRARIFETEAYDQGERGAHCFDGKRTARTEVMFAAGGITYVYFVYGMHWQLNIVTGSEGRGEAVLIRGARPIGDEAMLAEVRRRRGWGPGGRVPSRRVWADPGCWCDGPAKLCQALAVDGRHNAMTLDGSAPLWLEQGRPVAAEDIRTGPRVGIAYAGQDALLPWRFLSRAAAARVRG